MRKWYIAAYDKKTGDERGTEPIAECLAKSLLAIEGYENYQDCYDITSAGALFLSKNGYSIDLSEYDGQLEVCSG